MSAGYLPSVRGPFISQPSEVLRLEALVGDLEIRSPGGQQVRCSCSGVLALCADQLLAYLGLQRVGLQPFRWFSLWIQRIWRRVPAPPRSARSLSFGVVQTARCSNATLRSTRFVCYLYCHNLTLSTVCRPLVHAECLNMSSKDDFGFRSPRDVLISYPIGELCVFSHFQIFPTLCTSLRMADASAVFPRPSVLPLH